MHLDSTGDGIPDTYRSCVLIDSTGDGVLDSVTFDSTGDGINDTVVSRHQVVVSGESKS